MQTTLKIVAHDGILVMAFSPALVAQQYSRLLGLVKAAPTRDEIRKLVESWANAQGVKVTFDVE